MEVLRNRFFGDRILEDSPFGVEGSIANVKDSLEYACNAMNLLKTGFPSESFSCQERNPLLCRYVGDHLMIEVSASAGKDTGRRWDMVHKAVDAFEKSLQLLSQTEHTLKQTSKDEIWRHIKLGYCYIVAKNLKDPYCADITGKELAVDGECHLNTAINHLQIALDLAITNKHDDVLEPIRKTLGIAHFFKALELVGRAQKFENLIPKFQNHSDFKRILEIHESIIRLELKEDDGNPSHVYLHSLIVRAELAADTAEGRLNGAFKWDGKWLKLEVTYEGLKDAVKLDWMKTVSIKRPIFAANFYVRCGETSARSSANTSRKG